MREQAQQEMARPWQWGRQHCQPWLPILPCTLAPCHTTLVPPTRWVKCISLPFDFASDHVPSFGRYQDATMTCVLTCLLVLPFP